jgi:FKBP-type peptidyl-prolyl cis-trans isomerase FkpA
MKYSFILIAIIGLAFTSCKKQNECNFTVPTVSVPAAEAKELDAFIKSKAPEATKDKRGFYYFIKKAGEGANPTPCTTVNVYYRGLYTDGVVFERSGSIVEELPLPNTMYGWQMALPLIKPGGNIIFYLPPSLCFGDQRLNTPKNKILVYDVQLVYTF